ncbi:MAG: hypothetical protein ACW99A_14670 [Candidatus Kariarchaeaceae archaeon]
MHSIVLSVGFAAGLAAGLKIPIIGDAFAMLIVGLLLMSSQYFLLLKQFDITGNWILYSFVGLIVGVGLSFLFILLTDKIFGLKNSHILSLPISLVVLTIFQAFLLKGQLQHLYIWPAFSLLALILSTLILYVINRRFNLAFDLLATRKPQLSKIPVWGFTGFVVGLIYGLVTGQVLVNSID